MPLGIGYAAGQGIYGYIFSEAAGIIRQIQQTAKVVIGPGVSSLVVVVLLAPNLRTEFECLIAAHPTGGVAEFHGVLSKLRRRGR